MWFQVRFNVFTQRIFFYFPVLQTAENIFRKIYPIYSLFTFCFLSGYSVALHFILPLVHIIPSPYNYAGIVLILLGLVLNIRTDQLFKKNKTTVKPDENPSTIITEGPFRFSRNPMYFGMLLALAGVSLILGSLTSFAGAVLFVTAMEIKFIPIEEKNMKEAFGEEFEAYRKKVRRWI